LLIEDYVKVDSKGRITLPAHMRLALGIEEGYVLRLVADLERGTILIPLYQDWRNIRVDKFTASSIDEICQALTKFGDAILKIDCKRILDNFECTIVFGEKREEEV